MTKGAGFGIVFGVILSVGLPSSVSAGSVEPAQTQYVALRDTSDPEPLDTTSGVVAGGELPTPLLTGNKDWCLTDSEKQPQKAGDASCWYDSYEDCKKAARSSSSKLCYHKSETSK